MTVYRRWLEAGHVRQRIGHDNLAMLRLMKERHRLAVPHLVAMTSRGAIVPPPAHAGKERTIAARIRTRSQWSFDDVQTSARISSDRFHHRDDRIEGEVR